MLFPFFYSIAPLLRAIFICGCEAVNSYMKTVYVAFKRLNFMFLCISGIKDVEDSNVQKDIPAYIRRRCCCLFVKCRSIDSNSHTGLPQDRDSAADTALDGIPTRTANSPERSYMPQVSIRVLMFGRFFCRGRFPVVVEIPPFARRRPNSDNDLAFTL